MNFNISLTDVIGKKVWKNPSTNSKFAPKPFKSGLKINTVIGITTHPITGRDAFTFAEDDSIVECRICSQSSDVLCLATHFQWLLVSLCGFKYQL